MVDEGPSPDVVRGLKPRETSSAAMSAARWATPPPFWTWTAIEDGGIVGVAEGAALAPLAVVSGWSSAIVLNSAAAPGSTRCSSERPSTVTPAVWRVAKVTRSVGTLLRSVPRPISLVTESSELSTVSACPAAGASRGRRRARGRWRPRR